MAEYNIYPAVDEDYNFPPEVRQAAAESIEIKEVIESKRQLQTFRWPNEAAKLLETTMLEGDVGYLIDSNSEYVYIDNVWVRQARVFRWVLETEIATQTLMQDGDRGFVTSTNKDYVYDGAVWGPVYPGIAQAGLDLYSDLTALDIKGRLGGTALELAVGSDLNADRPAGMYMAWSVLNAPTPGWVYYTYQRHNADYAHMTAVALDGFRSYERTKANKVWNKWIPTTSAYATRQRNLAIDIPLTTWTDVWYDENTADLYGLILSGGTPFDNQFLLKFPGRYLLTAQAAFSGGNFNAGEQAGLRFMKNANEEVAELTHWAQRGDELMHLSEYVTSDGNSTVRLQVYNGGAVPRPLSYNGHSRKTRFNVQYLGR